MDMEDGQIVELFWKRDKRAIKEVECAYAPLLQQIAKNITASREDAEECVNDTYLKLWNSIPPERPLSLKNYAARLVRNLAIDVYRRNQSRGKLCEMELISEEMESIFGRTEENFDLLELKEIVNSFLQGLERKSRMLFVRRYFGAESIGELAEEFQMRESAVKMRLSRTREKLRKHLEKEGILI